MKPERLPRGSAVLHARMRVVISQYDVVAAIALLLKNKKVVDSRAMCEKAIRYILRRWGVTGFVIIQVKMSLETRTAADRLVARHFPEFVRKPSPPNNPLPCWN